MDGENEVKLAGSDNLELKLRYLDVLRSRRGVSSHGPKDPGVLHPPSNRVKKDPEREVVQDMYEKVGYSAKQGFINLEHGIPPPQTMTEEECESHVVGLVLAQMYNLRKGTELFGKRADEAVLTDLTQIDDFKTYTPVHKHELSERDRRDALESMMKIIEK